jgi:DUF4097 and DUF4098 domain-containing protein YvlB
MRRPTLLLLLLLVCLLPACVTEPPQYTELETRVVDHKDSQTILIQIDNGDVTLLGSDDDRVVIDGQVLFVDDLEYQIDADENRILIKINIQHADAQYSPLHVIVRVPQRSRVKVETDDADVFARGVQADIEVASTSGNIEFEQVMGGLILRSNRGNVTVQKCSGDINVVGNYGALTLQDTNGKAAASTIMGNIVFSGLIQAGDNIRLEADHGSVAVNLSGDSALTLQVRSTSGDVTCMLTGVSSSTRTCDGEILSGDGSLTIRTVSGAITLQSIP